MRAVQINAIGPLRVVKSLLPLLESGSSKVGASALEPLRTWAVSAQLVIHNVWHGMVPVSPTRIG